MITSATLRDVRDTVRVATLDVAHSRRRSTVAVGPLDLPSVADLNAGFDKMAAHGATSRLSLQPSTTSSRWPVVHTDDPVVIATPALPAGTDPTALIERARTTSGRRGVHVITSGEYLAIDFSHGLGEVLMINALLDSLLGTLDPADPAVWSRYRHRLSPLLVAATRTFAGDPRKVAQLVAEQSGRRRPAPQRTVAAGAPPAYAPATRTIGLPAEVVKHVRRYRDAALPGVSLVALFTHALWTALAEAGVPMDPVVTVPFDARRYLPATRDTLATFSAGLDFEIESPAGPARLHAAMTRAARSGRPVANLVLGTVKTRRRLWQHAHRDVVGALAPGPIRLLHSNVGELPRTGRWPFSDPALARLLVASDPAHTNAITVTSASTLGNLWFTAEFHSSAVKPELVTAALRLVADRAKSDSLAEKTGKVR